MMGVLGEVEFRGMIILFFEDLKMFPVAVTG